MAYGSTSSIGWVVRGGMHNHMSNASCALAAMIALVGCRSLSERSYATSSAAVESRTEYADEMRRAHVGNFVARYLAYLVTGCPLDEQGECVEAK